MPPRPVSSCHHTALERALGLRLTHPAAPCWPDPPLSMVLEIVAWPLLQAPSFSGRSGVFLPCPLAPCGRPPAAPRAGVPGLGPGPWLPASGSFKQLLGLPLVPPRRLSHNILSTLSSQWLTAERPGPGGDSGLPFSLHHLRLPLRLEPSGLSGVSNLNVIKLHNCRAFKGKNYVALMKNSMTLPHPVPLSNGFQVLVGLLLLISMLMDMLLLLFLIFSPQV